MDTIVTALNFLASRILLSVWLFTTSLAGIVNGVSVLRVQQPSQTLFSAVDLLGLGPEAKTVIDNVSAWATAPIRSDAVITICLLLSVALLGFGMQSSSSYGAASSHVLILISMQVDYSRTFWTILCTLLIFLAVAKRFPACGRGVLGFLITPLIALFLAFSWLSGPRASGPRTQAVRIEGPVTVEADQPMRSPRPR